MEPKKNPKIDLSRQGGILLNIGMAVSLLLVIVAFEWRSYDDSGLIDLGNVDDDFEDILEIPPTEQPPPPPPKVQVPEIIEVPDEEEIEEEIKLEIDVEINDADAVEEIIIQEAPEEEKVDEIFTIVEEPASFPGGIEAFYAYLNKELKYPRQAQRMGIEGRVFVQFVVERNGELTDVKVVKGIGAGCDEAAMEVLKNSPKWKPGKQRGKPVRQKMVQNILFKFAK